MAENEWSKIIARHAIGWEDGQDGMAVLLIPRFRKGPLAKWVQPRLKRPYHRVKLDNIGSFVWRLIDGETSFDAILQAMRNHFGETIEPADARLKKFFMLLHKNKFLDLFTSS